MLNKSLVHLKITDCNFRILDGKYISSRETSSFTGLNDVLRKTLLYEAKGNANLQSVELRNPHRLKYPNELA